MEKRTGEQCCDSQCFDFHVIEHGNTVQNEVKYSEFEKCVQQQKFDSLRSSRKQRDQETVRLSVEKRLSEKRLSISGGKDEKSVFDVCKERLDKKMQDIMKIAEGSSFSQISADLIVRRCASVLGTAGCMDVRNFLDLMVGVGNASEHQLFDIFTALDIDDTGILDRMMWISSVPIFFAVNIENTQAIFAEIDGDGNGILDEQEVSKFLTATISMVVPPTEKALREKLNTRVTRTIFNEIDKDGDGTLTSYEWYQWCCDMEGRLLPTSKALQCLEELLAEEEEIAIENERERRLEIPQASAEHLAKQLAKQGFSISQAEQEENNRDRKVASSISR